MTREEFRAEMATLERELELAIRYERGADVTLPRRTIERWRQWVFTLKEDGLLWK